MFLPHRKYCVTIARTIEAVLFKDTAAMYYDNLTKHINESCGCQVLVRVEKSITV
jgi:hypothetical protein